MKWDYYTEIRIKKMKLGPWGANCYIVACPETSEAVIIDTPATASRILAEVKELEIKYIIITHTHFDHTGAFKEVRTKLGATAAVHAAEVEGLPSPPDLVLNDTDILNFGSVKMKVLHTPGHSPGSICLLTGKHLFAGDTLFPGGPGYTANPTDFKQIIKSIKERLLVLPDETMVYPGHGDSTTIGEAKREFAEFASRPQPEGMYGDVKWGSD
jgi:hydroxyacylglutathione hydrolase